MSVLTSAGTARRPTGGIQVANFVLCGLLFVVAGTGIRRVPGGPAGTWAARMIGALDLPT